MLRTLSLAMTILVLPSGTALGDAQTDPGGNAALKYWQAFATLPKFTDAENKRIGECLTTPLDDSTREDADQGGVLVTDVAPRSS